MQAAVYDRYGSPDLLRVDQVPTPTPGPNEVLVRIDATTVSLVDCAFRSGTPYAARLVSGVLRPRQPILGTELAGEVVAVGQGVSRFAPGDAVFGGSDEGFGTHAQYVCLPADGVLVKRPAQLSLSEAAAASGGALTALPFLRDHGQLQAGQRVAIVGASGSVGTAAVQIAKFMGAHVTGVCSTSNVELVHSLGADRVVDYTAEDFTAGTSRYDVVFDAVGKSTFGRSRRVLVDGGRYLTTVMSWGALVRTAWTAIFGRKRCIFAATGLRPIPAKLEDLQWIHARIEAGELRTVVGRTYPLAEIAEAHRHVETGHKRGNLVLTVPHGEAA